MDTSQKLNKSRTGREQNRETGTTIEEELSGK